MSSDRPARRREIEDSTAARLAEIVAAAERAARQVIDEAEAEARARLDDAHEEADRIVAERLATLAELTDEIDAQAEALRRQAEELQRALAAAKAKIGGAADEADPGAAGEGSARGAESRRREDREADRDGDARRPAGPSLTVVGPPAGEEAPPAGADPDPAEAAPPAPGPGTLEPGLTPEATVPAANGSPAGARLLATQMAVSGSSREEIEARLRNGFAIADTQAILDAILGPER